MKRSSRAFTLIELLIVVAIIALLIAVLLPSLNRARQQARSTVCLSNLKGIGTAVYLYAGDHKDRLPGVGLGHGGSGTDVQGSWFTTLLKPYADPMIGRCPSDESDHFEIPVDPNNPDTIRRVSYASNYYTAGMIGQRRPIDRLSAFPRPTTTIYLCELVEQGAYASADHVHPEQWFSNPSVLAAQQVAIKRHGKTANYLMMDGHAQPYTFEMTYQVDLVNSSFPNIVWIHNLYDPLIAR